MRKCITAHTHTLVFERRVPRYQYPSLRALGILSSLGLARGSVRTVTKEQSGSLCRRCTATNREAHRSTANWGPKREHIGHGPVPNAYWSLSDLGVFYPSHAIVGVPKANMCGPCGATPVVAEQITLRLGVLLTHTGSEILGTFGDRLQQGRVAIAATGQLQHRQPKTTTKTNPRPADTGGRRTGSPTLTAGGRMILRMSDGDRIVDIPEKAHRCCHGPLGRTQQDKYN